MVTTVQNAVSDSTITPRRGRKPNARKGRKSNAKSQTQTQETSETKTKTEQEQSAKTESPRSEIENAQEDHTQKVDTKQDDIDIQIFIKELQDLCDHHRYRRYRFGVRCLGNRIILYEGTRYNVKATFLFPRLRTARGQVIVNDTIVHSMIRKYGGHTLKKFYERYGLGKYEHTLGRY